jgi:radical SAM superfamily enzyme YgiQ (UPF0313 family)
LAYIAAVLESENHKVDIIDAKASNYSLKDITARYAETGSAVVGITAMTHEIHLAGEIAGRIKAQNPETTVVIGGPHSTALPERTLREFPSFDIAVIGEGEKSMLEVVRGIESGDLNGDFDKIKGISYRTNGAIVTNESRPFMSPDELNDLPFPAWHLFPEQALPMLAGRGCPFRCKFCMRVLGNKVRMRSPENVLSEIEYLYARFGKTGSWFRDETFGLSRKWTGEYLDLLEGFNRNHGIKWSWKANSRVNIADPDIYGRMRAAGCSGLDFGIESGNPDVLNEIRKDITKENAENAIRTAKKAGLKTNAFFIIGHPDETFSTAMDTIRFAAKLNTDAIAVGIMVPYPGTDIWLMAKEGKGGYKLLTEDWRFYDKYFGNTIRLERLSEKQLKMLQSLCYIWFYSRNLKIGQGWKYFSAHFKEAMAMFRLLFKVGGD